MNEAGLVLRKVLCALPQFSYRFSSEVELHEGIAAALDCSGVQYEREVQASKSDRLDFLCESGVAIEAKIKGSMTKALLQVGRYCLLRQVSGLIIVATRPWACGQSIEAPLGKPVHILRLSAQAF